MLKRARILVFLLALAFARCGELPVVPPSPTIDNGFAVKEGNIELSLPIGFEKEDVVGIDSLYFRYSSVQISVSKEDQIGVANLERTLRSRDVIDVRSGGIDHPDEKGLRASYEFAPGRRTIQDPDKPFAKQLALDCKNSGQKASFLVLFSEMKDARIADRILDSVLVSCRRT